MLIARLATAAPQAVKQKIIALHSPPERDHALFYPEFQAPSGVLAPSSDARSP